MAITFNRTLFLFRRDLRLQDNTALLAAHASSKEVVPAFIFDTRQINEHAYQSKAGLQYMLESLEYLDECLRKRGTQLYCWQGIPEDILPGIIQSFSIDGIFINQDYTPFARERDAKIRDISAGAGIRFEAYHDVLLTAPGTVLKSDNAPYTIYTPFAKKARSNDIAKPRRNTFRNFFSVPNRALSFRHTAPVYVNNQNSFIPGGRKSALERMAAVTTLSDYAEKRNMPALESTTGLSAALKFGTISARELYYKTVACFEADHSLISELYWRDFFTHIAYHFPYIFRGCFHKKYDAIEWPGEEGDFESWCTGQTGFPIVDAGMRQLNTTGFMHNRVRMVVASFLVKDLLIDWRRGERYFAQRLIDYDPAVNNGNWQWAASTGCDAQPYFRIFNPWRQQDRFDPDCAYIKTWVPELEKATVQEISNLEFDASIAGYPKPIVNHKVQKDRAEDLFRGV